MKKISIKYLLGLLLIFMAILSPRAEADNSNVLSISLEKLDKLSSNEKEELYSFLKGEDVKFLAYKIGEAKTDQDPYNLLASLRTLDDKTLNEKYVKVEKSLNFVEDGKYIQLEDFEAGYYYAKAFVNKDSESRSLEFLFDFKKDGGESLTVYPKENPNWPTEKITKVILTKTDEDKKPLEGVEFKLYRIEGDKKEEVKLLFGYSYSEKGSYLNLLTDKNGKIEVKNLPLGNYQFEEIKSLEGYQKLDKPVGFKLEDYNLVELEVENKKEDKPKVGDHRFLKISDDDKKSPLEGAIFKVYKKEKDASYEVVLKDSKEYQVTSGKDGIFEVTDLPYGDYYLWEVKAPKGYLSLKDKIDFTIDSKSKDKIIAIKNLKKIPPIVPETGDLTTYLLGGLSLSLLPVGYSLKRKEKDYFKNDAE